MHGGVTVHIQPDFDELSVNKLNLKERGMIKPTSMYCQFQNYWMKTVWYVDHDND